MASGWDASAQAWIAVQGDGGDFGRVHVLDAPMLAIVEELGPARVLDVGCGEGRFCRMLADRGIITTGIDPTAALIDHRLMLTHVDEPPATGGPPDKRDRYNRVPNFHIMAWRKPA